jgi:hypothetical protein
MKKKRREMKSKGRLLPEAFSLKLLRGITRILKEYFQLDMGIKLPTDEAEQRSSPTSEFLHCK